MDRCPVRRGNLRRILLIASSGLACAGIGCAVNFPFARNDFGPSLSKDATVVEVANRVNANIERLRGWRSSDVHISGRGMPVRLSGTLAVERPRNFRLMASALGMEEADFGSNSDGFWFWVKRGQYNNVFQVRHEDIEQSEMLRQIPFQPDWLMEALGVIPVDAEHVTLGPGDSRETVNLVSEQLSPAGQTVRKVVRVDMRKGVIVGYSLHDASGHLIAKSTLGEHFRDDVTRIIMPHVVTLEWPQAAMSIKLEIGHIDINPASIPDKLWEVPRKPGYPTVDLGARTRSRAKDAMARSAERSRPSGGEPAGLEENPDRATSRAQHADANSSARDAEPEWSKPLQSASEIPDRDEPRAPLRGGRSTSGRARISESAAEPAADAFPRDEPVFDSPPARSSDPAEDPFAVRPH